MSDNKNDSDFTGTQRVSATRKTRPRAVMTVPFVFVRREAFLVARSILLQGLFKSKWRVPNLQRHH